MILGYLNHQQKLTEVKRLCQEWIQMEIAIYQVANIPAKDALINRLANIDWTGFASPQVVAEFNIINGDTASGSRMGVRFKQLCHDINCAVDPGFIKIMNRRLVTTLTVIYDHRERNAKRFIKNYPYLWVYFILQSELHRLQHLVQ